MVRNSGIRDKLRSNVLKELARERGSKRPREEVEKNESDDDDEEQSRLKNERLMSQARCKNNSLLSILPAPKNANVFGPTVKLDKLLKLPERADKISKEESQKLEETVDIQKDDSILEVDVGKMVGDVSHDMIKELTVEKSKPNSVIVPKGKEKQKNQITYLAQLGKATELERKEQAAQSRINKSAARSKYGW